MTIDDGGYYYGVGGSDGEEDGGRPVTLYEDVYVTLIALFADLYILNTIIILTGGFYIYIT